MRRNKDKDKDKDWSQLDELLEPFFPDEHADTGTAVAVEFRNRLVELEQQVMSQYTAMAAYATIGKSDGETARAESHSNLHRSQATLIGLIETLRNEVNARLESALEGRSTGGDLSVATSARIDNVEREVLSTASALQQCIRENQELRAQVADLVEQRMQEQGWLVSSGASAELSLR